MINISLIGPCSDHVLTHFCVASILQWRQVRRLPSKELDQPNLLLQFKLRHYPGSAG